MRFLRRSATVLPTLFLATALAACAADGGAMDEGDPTLTPEDLSPITAQSIDEGTVNEPDPDADKPAPLDEERSAEGTLSGIWVYDHVQAFANSACKYVGACSNGTYHGHQPHASRATDLMVSAYGTSTAAGSAKGDRLAVFATNNRKKFGIMYVIWKQRINSFDGRGWRWMENRGSITQNHYDHVHVSFYTTANMGLATDTGGSGGGGGGTSTATCQSYTLGRAVTAGTCVQSKVDHLWYQCSRSGSWLSAPAVRSGGAGPVGACTSKHVHTH